jgi:hypothetical protein
LVNGGSQPADDYTFFYGNGKAIHHLGNVHIPTEDKSYDIEDSFQHELERILDQFPNYHMKIFLGYYNAKVGRQDISKPAIGNESYMKLVMIMLL